MLFLGVIMRKVLIIFLLFCVGAVFCQAQSVETKPGFEISLSENLLAGNRPLMNFVGVNLGYSFKTNDKILMDLSLGASATGQYFRSQVLSIMYGHEFRLSERYGTQVAIGPGILRDINQEGVYSLKPVGVLDLQHRIYFSERSFVGFSGRAYLTKELHLASFIGFTWGAKL